MISGADKGIVSTAFYLSGLIQAYLFRLVSSSSILSDTVMILEFAWKPRCVVIISVNSVARSTFDISSCPVLIEPPVEIAGVQGGPVAVVSERLKTGSICKLCYRYLSKKNSVSIVIRTVYLPVL